jgi:hypothetical protein
MALYPFFIENQATQDICLNLVFGTRKTKKSQLQWI